MSDTMQETWTPAHANPTKNRVKRVIHWITRKKKQPDHTPMAGTLPADLAQLSQPELESRLLNVEAELRRAELHAGDDSNFAAFCKTFGLACIAGIFTLSAAGIAYSREGVGTIGIIGLSLLTVGAFFIHPHTRHVSVTARAQDRDRILRAIDQIAAANTTTWHQK